MKVVLEEIVLFRGMQFSLEKEGEVEVMVVTALLVVVYAVVVVFIAADISLTVKDNNNNNTNNGIKIVNSRDLTEEEYILFSCPYYYYL
jgi:hypothetical protein